MSYTLGIPHPFLNDAGTEQAQRLLKNLDPENLKIDGRQVTDILGFIARYARQVNHYNSQLQVSDWRAFFAGSLPFLVAEISKFDVVAIESDFNSLLEMVEADAEAENIQQLFDFIFFELIEPVNNWQRYFQPQDSALSLEINSLITANLQKPVKSYIGLFNAVNHWYCIPKRSLSSLLSGPWGLEFTDLFWRDDSFHHAGGGPGGRIRVIKNALVEIFQLFLGVIKELKTGSGEFMGESLLPADKNLRELHAPQLGLLFTFLKLFEHLQQDLNSLSEKHLRFFYQEVLKIEPRPVVPDQAHLVLAIQKSLDNYLLKQGTLFKNGKDKNGNDIFYALDEETVLDQAQAVSFKTLFINRSRQAVSRSCITSPATPALPAPADGSNEDGEDALNAGNDPCGCPQPANDDCLICDFIEGVYMAPQANKADGVEEDFADPATASWATLGARDSKFYPEEPVLPNSIPREHPHARIGFVVASPVLLLNEGERTVTFTIKGKYESEEDCELSLLNLDIRNIGETKWTVYDRCITEEVLGLSQKAVSYLENELEERSKLCFENDQELDAFLEILSAQNTPVFSSDDKEQIALHIERIEENKICITELAIEQANLEDTAATFIQEKIQSRKKICFQNETEIDVYLAVLDSNNNPIFEEHEKAYIKNNIEDLNLVYPPVSLIQWCITRSKIDAIFASLSIPAQRFLDSKFRRQPKLCFSTLQELDAFFTVKSAAGSSVFTTGVNGDVAKIKGVGTLQEDIAADQCITENTIQNLSEKARDYLFSRLQEKGRICFETLEELKAYLRIQDTSNVPYFTTGDAEYIENNIRQFNDRSILCIFPDVLPLLSVDGFNLLKERLDNVVNPNNSFYEGRICFDNEEEFEAFLNIVSPDEPLRFTEADKEVIRDNRVEVEVPGDYCIIEDIIPGLITERAKQFLKEQLDKKARLCFKSLSELDRFFNVKDQDGNFIFTKVGKDKIQQNAERVADPQIARIKCITQDILSALTGISQEARDYLTDRLSRRGRICFTKGPELELELDAFLTLENPNGDPLFDPVADKVEIMAEWEEFVSPNIVCISRDTVLNSSTLSPSARNFLFLEFLRSNKICFEDDEELNAFLEEKDGQGNPIFDESDVAQIKASSETVALFETSEQLFNIHFSGEKGWIPAEGFTNRFLIDSAGGTVTLEIEGMISDDIEPITFADAKALEEDFQTHLPLAKVELNNEVMVTCQGAPCPPCCELERCLPHEEEVAISLYHFFKDLKIDDFCIDVKVCGLRQTLVVQNDENLQDINGPIFPFGARPSIDSNFYIGSQEVFFKRWRKLWLNINWKGLPEGLDFEKYYLGYGEVTSQGLLGVRNDKFKMQVSVLEELAWRKEKEEALIGNVSVDNPYTVEDCPKDNTAPTTKDHRPLFRDTDPLNPLCIQGNPFMQTIEIDSEFFGLQRVPRGLGTTPITEYLAGTQNGFMRLALKCQHFQHREYPFVLARQMLAFGKFPEEFVFGAVYVYEDEVVVDEQNFVTNLQREGLSLFEFFQQVERACELIVKGDDCAGVIVQEIKSAIDPSLLTQLKNNLKTNIKSDVNALIGAEITRVKGSVGAGTISRLIDDLNPEIDTFVTQSDITARIHIALNDFSADVIDGIAAASATLDQFSNQVIGHLTALLAPPAGDPNEPLFIAFRDSIVASINNLLADDPTDAQLESLSQDIVDNTINDTVLGGLNSAERIALRDVIRPTLNNTGNLNDSDLAQALADQISAEPNVTLDAAQQATLKTEIEGLLINPGPQTLDEQAENIVFNFVNPKLGGLNEAQFGQLTTAIQNELNTSLPSSGGVLALANGIVDLFIDAFTPAGANLGTELKEDIEAELVSFLSTVKAGATVSAADRNTATEAIRDILELKLKEFISSNAFRTQLEGLLDTLSSTLQTSADGSIETAIDQVFTALNLDVIGLARITEEVELCACGAYQDIGVSCAVDDSVGGKLDQIIEMEAGSADPAVQAAYLAIFNTNPTIPDRTELITLISNYCSLLSFSANGGSYAANLLQRDQLEHALADAQQAYLDALQSGNEATIKEKKDLLDQAIRNWNKFAQPLADFLEGLDELDANDDASEPVKLRALLPYLGLDNLTYGLSVFIRNKKFLNDKIRRGTVAIPNEPYTPEIKELVLDYTATACKGKDEIKFIHLYPYEKTHKAVGFRGPGGHGQGDPNVAEDLHLLPHHTEEGTLFLGFEKLTPGGIVQLLFELAEATGDTELLRPVLKWEYLAKDNTWKELRQPKDVLSDETKNLSVSGIVRINIPKDIANPEKAAEQGITLMPPELRWLRVSAHQNAEAFSETRGIFTQAVKVTYKPLENNERDKMVTEAKEIKALAVADSNVKGIEQPYKSFGGRLPEAGNNFSKRASERLRHKGRAVNVFDYERLVLERFPKIYRAKCITHSLGLPAPEYVRDLEVAPGFVNIAVIPDLGQVVSSNQLEPRAPISLLTEIEDYLQAKNSPFVRLKAMNPRYEKVNLDVEVKFRKGINVEFFISKLKEDLIYFLAPWLKGDTSKLNFGKNLTRSSLVRFIENLDYITFISRLGMVHQDDVCQAVEAPPRAGENGNNGGNGENGGKEENGDNDPNRHLARNPRVEPPKGNAQEFCGQEYSFCQTRPPDCKVEALFPLTARSILTAGEVTVKAYEK